MYFSLFYLVYELVNTLLNEGKFKDTNAEIIIKWLIKYVLSTLLIVYSFEIINMIFILFSRAAGDAMSSLISSTDAEAALSAVKIDEIIAEAREGLADQPFFAVLSFYLVSALVMMISWLMKPAVEFIVLCRFVEIYVYMVVAPMAITTLPMKGEWGQLGASYIKNMIAYALQALLIVAIFGIYFGFLAGTLVMASTASSLDNLSLELLVSSLVLIVTLFRTGSIAKSIMTSR